MTYEEALREIRVDTSTRLRWGFDVVGPWMGIGLLIGFGLSLGLVGFLWPKNIDAVHGLQEQLAIMLLLGSVLLSPLIAVFTLVLTRLKSGANPLNPPLDARGLGIYLADPEKQTTKTLIEWVSDLETRLGCLRKQAKKTVATNMTRGKHFFDHAGGRHVRDRIRVLSERHKRISLSLRRRYASADVPNEETGTKVVLLDSPTNDSLTEQIEEAVRELEE